MQALQVVCYVAFTLHAIINLYITLHPQDTVMRLEQKKLDDIEFPIIFKICLNPAFRINELKQAGYASLWAYFHGWSKYQKPAVYGWAGHHQNGSAISSVKGICCLCFCLSFLCC